MFLKNWLLVSLIFSFLCVFCCCRLFCVFWWVFISFISTLIFIFFFLLTLDFVVFPSYFRNKTRLFIWDCSSFLRWSYIAINFPLIIAFVASLRFKRVAFPFSFVSMFSLISLLMHWLFSSMLVSRYMFVFLKF